MVKYPITSVISAILIANFLHGYYLNIDLSNITQDKLEKINQVGVFTPTQIYDGAFIAYISHAFAHIGWLHLMLNLFSFLAFGSEIEIYESKLRYCLIIALSAIAGFGVELLISEPILAGFSGAVYGLMGFVLARNRIQWKTREKRILAVIIGSGFLIECILDYFQVLKIGILAHLGGFICGFLLGCLGNKSSYGKKRFQIEHVFLSMLLLIALSPII